MTNIEDDLNVTKSLIVERMGIPPEEVVLSASLRDDLGLDSLDALELVSAMEEELGVTVPEEEIGQLATVSDIVSYLKGSRDRRSP